MNAEFAQAINNLNALYNTGAIDKATLNLLLSGLVTAPVAAPAVVAPVAAAPAPVSARKSRSKEIARPNVKAKLNRKTIQSVSLLQNHVKLLRSFKGHLKFLMLLTLLMGLIRFGMNLGNYRRI
jgi:hypothetical protein